MGFSKSSAAFLALLLAAEGAGAASVFPDEQSQSPDVPARRLVEISLFPKAGAFPGETRENYFMSHNGEIINLAGKIKDAPRWMKLDRHILTEKVIRRFNANQQAMIVSVIKDRDRLEDPDEVSPENFVYWLKDPSRIEMVKRFIERGVNVNAEGTIIIAEDATISAKFRPLTVASESGNLEAVRLLLKAGADPNFTISSSRYGYEMTPLHIAVSRKDLEMVKILVEGGAKINAEAWGYGGHPGLTPTQLAKDMGYTEIEAYLRSKGGAVNYGYIAWRIGGQAIVVVLIPFLLVMKLITGSF